MARGSSTLARRVRHGSRASSWKTRARSAEGPVSGCPSWAISPASGDSRPARVRSRVDLPQPEGPTTVRIPPGACPGRHRPGRARPGGRDRRRTG
ncbi:putative Taurine import ATP-binding protein TauB [Streptomyces afghaniensis 772]|uniref:Putative Taurine import ATP-binding protein TauB n=1 Tax=Streptomyces afghaniensis 772 TaxID=1283301 RepID=S4MS66_9ACTN|nr:putative Taurine import ATP-binding protein TauB [Streptomyces afghaniensis 772]